MKATIWQDFKSREGAHEKKNVFFSTEFVDVWFGKYP